MPQAFWRDGSVNYYERYTRIADFLNQRIHPHTVEGALAAQIARVEEAVKKGISGSALLDIVMQNNSWLTDHGPEHVKTVILRASKLLSASHCALYPYEIYILLVAIHFHDVGNIYGREEHEKQIAKVMSTMDESIIGNDDFEKRLIRSIAAAHGGSVNGDQDTIRHLPYQRFVKAQKVRPHLLAAVLRFADELAEDYTRASRFALENNLLLQASAVYHQYAERLREVNIEDGTIDIYFELNKDIAIRQFAKGEKQTFLLDEIFDRTLKIHREHVYCMRYMREHINLNSISVRIAIFKTDYMEELLKLDYKMEERGYPPKPVRGIHDICDNLKDTDGNLITGDILRLRIEAIQG
jgi:hypothetical protein